MIKSDVKGHDCGLFKFILQNLLPGIVKKTKVVIQDSQHPGCEAKPGPHEKKH
jgi:hypothetical protein